MVEPIMETSRLMDMPPSNGKYTWSNKRLGKNNIKERLDRILIQDKIATNYSNIKSRIIHNIASDHKPMVISLGNMENLGPTPFRYSPIWNESGEAKKVIAVVWTNQIIGSPSYVWESKLKALRKELKKWAKNSQIETQKRKTEIIKK